jgi:hypothetical protein
MAFEFFRRRQKLVIVVMVVLMVAFLFSAGMQSLFSGGGGDSVVGQSDVGEISADDYRQADMDITLLQQYLGLANPDRLAMYALNLGEELYPGDLAFAQLVMGPGEGQIDANLGFAILLAEAREAGFEVSEADVDGYFAAIGAAPDGESYQSIIDRMRLDQPGLTAKHLRGAVADWLTIMRHYEAAKVESAPSEQQLRHLFVELAEGMDLQVVRLDAEDFTDEVAEPTAQEIDQQFQARRNRFAGQFADAADLGFGYRQPNRAAIDYMLLSREPLARAVQVTPDQIQQYYLDNVQEFTTTRPDGGTEQRQISEVRQQIIERLKPQIVERRMQELAAQVQAQLDRYDPAQAGGVGPYQWIQQQMVAPAEALLGRTVGPMQVEGVTLQQAVERLAQAANLPAVVYPWGPVGDNDIDPEIKVSLDLERGATLAEALGQLNEQIDMPEMSWHRVSGFGEAIFPRSSASQLKMLPVEAGSTGLANIVEIAEHPTLGSAVTPGGQPLWQHVFLAEPFEQDGAGVMSVGEAGMTLDVRGQGKLLWTLSDASAAHVPEQMTDEIRQQVIADLKLQKALPLAKARAEELALQAGPKTTSLQEVAEKAGLDTYETGMFPRKMPSSPAQRLVQQGRFVAAALVQPLQIEWTSVPGIGMPTPQLRQTLIERLFRLAPAEKDPPYTDKPVGVLTEPAALRGAVVVQRIDYNPPVTSTYEEQGRRQLLAQEMFIRDWQNRVLWFSRPQIAQRVNFRTGQD